MNGKMNIGGIRFVPLLMVISQALLTGFVVYWLAGQYRNEREVLREEVTRLYVESRDQVVDSLVFSRFVRPAIGDSANLIVSKRFSADSLNSGSRKIILADTLADCLPSIGNENRISITVSDTVVMHDHLEPVAVRRKTSTTDYLIRGVQLMIRHAGDSAGTGILQEAILPDKLDTALFKGTFYAKTIEKLPRLDYTWTEGSDSLIHPGKDSPVRVVSMLPDGLPGLEVTREFGYLGGRIIPQFLFALVLLVLTGSAFWFTNRGLERQLMLNRLRNDFVSNITHELKTPVATVKVAIEALKDYNKMKDPGLTHEYLAMAGEEMNRLDGLIGKVLDQSMIGDRSRFMNPVSSDLREITSSVLKSMQPLVSAREATITTEWPDEPVIVPVDPDYFPGVLINLVDNSLKYGPVHPAIHMRTWLKGKDTFMEISDNGPGIPKEFLARVFDRFFRVPTGNIHNIKGYGLGLTYARLVMEQHGGAITVRNLPEGGCAFTLKLPDKA